MRLPAPESAALGVAAVLLALQATAAAVFAAVEVTEIRGSRPEVGIGVALIMLGYAVLLVLVARGVFAGRRWSRGPAVVTQLILLLLGWSFRPPPTTVVGFVLALVAVVALVCLLLPSSTSAFVGKDAAA